MKTFTHGSVFPAYPIAQHPTDDSYYLNHTIEGNSGLPASIYTEASANKKDFTDFNTVIYGHNAGEGRMFSNLLNYRDEAVLDENREIVIYTPEAEYHYTIFAAVLFGDEYLPYYYYRVKGGAVVSTGINKYIYITVNRKFDNRIRVSYSKTEIVDEVAELRHELVRESLKMVGICSGIEITSIADIPSGTGLGSSSTFTM